MDKPDSSGPLASGGSGGEDHRLGRALAGKYMTFRLGQEVYGLQILGVREIIRLMAITRVPQAAACVRGVINLRGRVIPVIDLGLRFGMDAIVPTDQTVIIVAQGQQRGREVTMGLMVDEVLEVLPVSAKQVASLPALGPEDVEPVFIKAVGKLAERVIFLLDIDAVLQVDSPQGSEEP